METGQTPTLKTYRGNCHCGAFVYEAQLPEIKGVGQCNCSICYKKGYLWVFPPSNESVKVVKGNEDELAQYQFGEKKLVHKFCSRCGSGIMARGRSPTGATFGLNARCIQGLKSSGLSKKFFDGAAISPKRETPKFIGRQPNAEITDARTYPGSCHCGAVTLVLKSEPLDAANVDSIAECNCSICERNAYAWNFPSIHQVVVDGAEHLSTYRFGRELIHHKFCRTCGVNLISCPVGLTEGEVEALPDGLMPFFGRPGPCQPVNLRVLDNFVVSAVPIAKRDGYNLTMPLYVEP